MSQTYAFIANTSDGAVAVDHLQRIVLWNDAATAILGYTANEVLGKYCYEVMGCKDGEGCVECHPGCHAMETARRLDFPSNKDLAIRTKAGKTIWINITWIVVPSRTRELSVLLHLFRERSQRRELERAVDEFTSLVSRITQGQVPGSQRDRPDDACVRLTRREREILRHLTAGLTTEAIAERLEITSRTVRNHVSHILGKLDVHSRLEAVTYSIQNGLV